jgi:nucleoside-diphosphate-sugar epimerase
MIDKKIKIGITGSTGVLGSILCKKLEKKKKYKVFKFKHDIKNISKVNQWIKKNNFDSIFHLASIVPVTKCNEDPLEASQTNVGGTFNILNSLSTQKKIPWFFYASTSHVYKVKNKPISEESTLLPRTFYGYTKWLGEVIIENYSLKYNVPFCIGRIFSFYSNLQSKEFLYPSVKRKIKNDKGKIFIRNANYIIDIQKAEDVIEIILKLFKNKKEGTYNIAKGKGIKIKNFAKTLTKKKIIVKTNTSKSIKVVADINKLKFSLT